MPIAVSFGVKTKGDIEALEPSVPTRRSWAAHVACVADALRPDRDVVEDFRLCSSSWVRPQLAAAGPPG
jgi:hypothetical protein